MEQTNKVILDPNLKFNLMHIDGKHYSGRSLCELLDGTIAIISTVQDMNCMEGDKKAAPGAVTYSMDILMERAVSNICTVFEFLVAIFDEGVEVAND